MLGAPTLWRFQPEADRWLFFGTVPTVWLQERIKMAQPPWWEVIISSIYMSFFILPYVVAGVLWLRNRSDWAAFVRRFVALSFAALVVYVVLPAAPPWAAARCTPADVVGGPSNPPLHVPKSRGRSRRRAAGRDAHEPARCPPIRGADFYPRLGNAASAVGRRAGQLRTGQRESGRGDSLAARRVDRDDLDVPVATCQGAGGARYWWLIRWRWPSCWCTPPSTSWSTSCWAGRSPRRCLRCIGLSTRHGPAVERRSQPSPTRLSQPAILVAASP